MTALDWKQIVASVAPTLATMLGGPLAGMAVSAIGDKFLGKKDATPAEVQAAVLAASPADLVKFKEIEADVTKALSDADVKLEAIAAGDTASARDREVKLQDWTPRVLAIVIILGWFGAQWLLFSHQVDPSAKDILASTDSKLGDALMLVLYYYFGSSFSSHSKDRTIQKIAEQP